MYLFLADIVLSVHALFVLFVVAMVPLILIGGAYRWQWVRSRCLRILHLGGICFVAAQSWLGMVCPLTTLEQWLRRQVDERAYSGGFIEHWLHQLLFWDFPPWVFVVVYTVFAALVFSTWILVPPGRRSSFSDQQQDKGSQAKHD